MDKIENFLGKDLYIPSGRNNIVADIDRTVRDIIRNFRVTKGKDPPQLAVTRDIYREMVKEYQPSKRIPTPALWAGRKISSVYGVPIIITEEATRYDKNGCYRRSIVE